MDKDMGRAISITIEGHEVRVDGHPMLSYSAAKREAYADAQPSTGLLVWSLDREQVEHLLERVPSKQLATESWGSEHLPGCPRRAPGRARKLWAGQGWAPCDGCDSVLEGRA